MADDSLTESDEPLSAPDSNDGNPPLVKRLLRKLTQKRGITIVILSSAAVVTAVIFYLRSHANIITDEQKLEIALELIDDVDDLDDRHRATRIARMLMDADYRSPDFEGACEFILGIAAFRDAEQRASVEKDQYYIGAIQFLREADRRALIKERLPEWEYALGLSLYRIGSAGKALPHLEKAIDTYPPGKQQAVVAACEVYLDLRTADALQKAYKLNSLVVEAKNIDPELKDRAWLQRAQICLQLDRNDEAEQALTHVSAKRSENQGTIVFRGQTLMAEERYQEAIDVLAPVARGVGLVEIYSRQAIYLQGVCAERLGQNEIAINAYRRCAQKYPDSHEGVAAGISAADLLRDAARNEEALEVYRRTLEQIDNAEDFRNRWISLETLRTRILGAWDGWVQNRRFDEAIKLAKVMPPAVKPAQAQQLEALASQRWAEHLQEKLASTPYSLRAPIETELRRRWKASGAAYKRLGRTLDFDENAPQAIWTSAQHFKRGHDFDSALEQYTRFIHRESGRRIPTALVRRGEVLMDLGRFEEALEEFQTVLKHHATDPAFFEAQVLTGKCYQELDQQDQAEDTWRAVLNSPTLSPDAQEWKQSLLALGTYLHHRATTDLISSRSPKNATNQQLVTDLQSKAFDRADESVTLLNQYLVRYPTDEGALEARYFLAAALQQSTERHQAKLKTAETDNARADIRNQINITLKKAVKEYRTLQNQLFRLDERDRLAPLERWFLRDCYFEIAHANFALQDYEAAIIAYHGAANRYPRDPHVILAYLQMAECHKQLDNLPQARSMLEQAKVILKQMDDTSFDSQRTNLNREEWEIWRSHHGTLQDVAPITPVKQQ